LKSESSLFPSRLHGSMHLSTRQYARIVDSWVRQLGLDKASYGRLGAVQLLLGHTRPESTARYLGIEVNDALEMAVQTEV
jgi:integrase